MPQNKRFHSILTRFAVGTALALLMAGVLSVWFVYVSDVDYVNAERATSTDEAENLLKDIFNTFGYDDLLSSGDAPMHVWLQRAMREFATYSDIDCVYLYTVNPERTQRTFLFVVASDPKVDAQLQELRSFGAVSKVPLSEPELKALDGERDIVPEETNNQFGHHYCWYRAVELPDGHGRALLGIDQDVRKYYDVIDEDMWYYATLIGIFLVCIAVVELILLRRNVVKPVRDVTMHMRTFAKMGAVEDKLQVRRNDEIGEIAQTFNSMTDDIEHYMQRIEHMTEERVAANTELQVAKSIQQGLVPASKQLVGAGYDVYAFARTARAVGGDFYDLFEVEDGRVACVLADVSGKGVSAALFMSMFMTLLHEMLYREVDPARALNEANDMVVQNNTGNMFVTAVAAVFDPETGVLTFANAGHMPPLVVGRGYLDPDPGIALGLFEDAGIVNETLELEPGEGVLFYTDGATDANNMDKEFFGETRLEQAVADTRNARGAVDATVAAVDGFTGEAVQFDDLTLVSLFAPAVEKRTWSATLEPELSSFAQVSEQLEAFCGECDSVRKHAQLACDEAFANVVSYSGATFAEFEITRKGKRLVVRLSDDGVPFNPLEMDMGERAFEDLEFGGMGISFVKKSCDEVTYAYEDGRNVLTMRFTL